MKYLIPFLFALTLLIPTQSNAAPSHSKLPTISIQSVSKDSTVTIVTHNFPANDSFKVLMGEMGTRGVGGIRVATQKSGKGGSFTATYNIPEALKGDYRIAIRLMSPSSGYFAYNWFYNDTTNTGKTSTTTKIPTFSIKSVVRNDTVTIKTNNFPASDSFKVTMGYMGTRGVGGYVVATQKSGSGGTFTATYDIPDELKGEYRIAIRLESSTSGYFAYNWFYNNTANGTSGNSGTGGIPSSKLAPGTIPTFYIKSVARNDTVTIKTNNFPADDTFTVRMGYMWTRGVGGYIVDTQDSGNGGTFSAIYDIPAELKGQYRIAIRLESSASGYFAYNWFYNNTATVP